MKNFKRIASLLLAMTMILCMAMPIFADGEDASATESTLTIVTKAGHTYKVYQLLKGEVSDATTGENGTVSGTLSNTTVGANAIKDATVESITAALKGEDGNNLTGAALGDAAYALVDTTSDAYKTIVGDGKNMSEKVENGYYVIVDTWTGEESETETLSRYMVTVVGNTTVTPKDTTVEIDKKIVDTDANKPIDENGKTDTASIGDTINYEITGKVPNTAGYKYFYYVVHDTMSKGLTLDETSFVVTVGETILTKGTDYYVYVTKNDDGTTVFELAFEDMANLVNEGKATVGAKISIKYNATVNDDAEIGVIPNTNEVYPIFSNNPGSSDRNDKKDDNGNTIPGIPSEDVVTGEGPKKTTKTYVTELIISKVDNEGKKLTGAEFTLTGENLNKVIIETNLTFVVAGEGETAEYYELTNGTFTKNAPKATTYKERGEVTELSQLYEKKGDDTYEPTTDTSIVEGKTYYVVDVLTNADQYVSTTPTHVRKTTVTASTEATGEPKKVVGTVNAEGYLIFTGLNAGKYTLTETKTPEGYNTMAPIDFTITAKTEDATAIEGGTIKWESNNAQIVLDEVNGVFDATIVNLPGSNLPSTGGIGTTIFYIVGGVLLAGAVVLLITKRRMSIDE